MPKVVDESVIFNAALELLVSHGYEGATTRKIAEMAGVNEVTLFRKYGSKAILFEKAVEHRFSDTPLNKIFYTGELQADLVAFVKAYLETSETHGGIILMVLVELVRNPDLGRLFDTPWKNLQTILGILQRYQEQGLLKDESRFASLNALIGPIMVSQMLRRADLDLPVPAIDPQAHVDSFLRGKQVLPIMHAEANSGDPAP